MHRQLRARPPLDLLVWSVHEPPCPRTFLLGAAAVRGTYVRLLWSEEHGGAHKHYLLRVFISGGGRQVSP